MKRRSYLTFLSLAFLALSLWACSSEGKDKQTLLAEKKKALVTLQQEIAALEREVGAGAEEKTQTRKLVELLPLAKTEFLHFIEVQGTVESDQNINVMPEMQGVIKSVLVKEGQNVSAGQTIAILDQSLLQTQIAELETRLELANTLFEKRQNLWKQNIGSEIEYLQAKNQKESLEKNILALKTQMGKAVVTAPISGVIDAVFAKQGEIGSPMSPMVRIVNLSQVTVTAEVSEAYLADVNKGDEVTVSMPAMNVEQKEKISFVSQAINPTNRTFTIQIDINNKDGNFKPNAVTTVKINDFTQKDAVVVPTNVVQLGTDGNKFLYIAEKQGSEMLAKKVVVETGISYDGQTLIKSGLTGSEQVIVKGYNEVITGDVLRL
ncbi:efflux RND transporter periplasmic adaptor subunit [Hugenholtzia roseola]|uniref:efflux RND transporter periplasmic adaptor subunit n=1 Tax=Hugenholtzia roseola TaxID=1002 RepID=UPI0003F81661|nr:efflux RND transporter periplasmic adaptor subunit [Hugenholtzia roseola]